MIQLIRLLTDVFRHHAFRSLCSGQAEVQNLEITVVTNGNIRWLEILWRKRNRAG